MVEEKATFIPSRVFPPKQRQILEAALECVKKWGIERVTLNDIAYEANVARSTVYSYYKNRDEVVREALLQSGYQFGEKLFEFILQFDSAEERLVESVLKALKMLKDEPSLMLISDKTLSEMVQDHSLTTPEGLDISTALIAVIMQDPSYSEEELREMNEVAMRFMLSMLMMESPVKRDENELRGFIARRLLPALGLQTPDKYKKYKRLS